MRNGLINRQELSLILSGPVPIIQGAPEPEEQLKSIGYDLTLGGLREPTFYGFEGEIRQGSKRPLLRGANELKPNRKGYYDLANGQGYLVSFNETLRLPENVTATVHSASILIRNGAAIHAPVHGPGHQGIIQGMLTTHFRSGIRLERNARIARILFYWS